MQDILTYLNSTQRKSRKAKVKSKRRWENFKDKMHSFPKWFGIYLAFTGIFTFNCFILQEAFQTVMFGGWGAFQAKEYRLIKRQLATMEKLRTTLIIVNYAGGWLNPFGYVAYAGYVKAEREYIDATGARLFAEAPEMFVGEVVTFTFTPQEEEPNGDHSIYRNGAMSVISRSLKPIVTGMVLMENGKIFVDERKVNKDDKKN